MAGFIHKLESRLSLPLPGATAQQAMKARRSTGASIYFDHEGPPREGGVAILLFQDHGQWFFPLMKRKEYPGIHSGQISFPGGKKEKSDRNLMETALRESREELGLQVGTDQGDRKSDGIIHYR